MFREMEWRNIGPHRASRTKALDGVPSQPHTFYIGVVNGGVWKTTDAGRTWVPIFDQQPTGSIGALGGVALRSQRDLRRQPAKRRSVRILGPATACISPPTRARRGRISACATHSRSARSSIDPKDPNRLFVAALGHPYGPNTERGIFRSTDGGKSFERVLYKDENTGGTDVLLDPSNPNIVYAALWQARQGPWENGDFRGPGSGLFKSTDGGTTWRQLTAGLPTLEADRLGRIGIGIAPSRPSRLFAIVEARNSGRVSIGRCGRDVDAREQRSARAGPAVVMRPTFACIRPIPTS